MSKEEKYNGWTNRETWLVNLWIDNEESSQTYWRNEAKEIWANAQVEEHFTKFENAWLYLADALEEYFDNFEFGAPTHGLYKDMLTTAFGRVEWREIATSMIENVQLEQEAA